MKLNYFIFVDDFMIFCKDYRKLIGRILEIMSFFYEIFGLKVNEDKFVIVFGGVNEDIKVDLLKYFGLFLGILLIKYLGVILLFKMVLY